MSSELKAIRLQALAAVAAITASANGASFDTRPYGGEVRLALSSTAGTGTTPTLDVKIQHSDDGTTWIDSGVAFTRVTNAASAFEVLAVTAEKFKRYIRVVDTVGGTTPSFSRAVTFVGRRRAV